MKGHSSHNSASPALAGAAIQLGLPALLLALTTGMVRAAPGDLDPTFGTDGRLVLYTEYQSMQSIDDAVSLGDDTFVVIGNDVDFLGDWGTNLVLARVRTDGTVLARDAFVDSGGFDDGASRAIVTTDGKVTIVGSTCCRPGGYNLAVYRVNPDLSLDTGFGRDGIVLIDLGGDEKGTAITATPDGSLIAAATARAKCDAGYSCGQPLGLALIRLTSSGERDAAFADGQLLYAGGDAQAAALLTLSTGQLLLATNHFAGGSNLGCRLTRLTPDGRVDPAYATGGVLTLVDGEHGAVECRDVLRRADDAVVVVGSAWTVGDCSASTCSSAVAASVSADGALQADFNGGFAALPDLGAWNALNRVRIDSVGNIVALGVVSRQQPQDVCQINDVRPSDVVVMRITPAGRLDEAFGVIGASMLGQRARGYGSTMALILDDEDRAYVGTSEPNWTHRFNGIYRYGEDSFGTILRLVAAGAGPGIIEFDTCPHSQHEEASTTVDVAVRRIGGSSGNVTASYRTVEGSARMGQEYVDTSGILSWSDGDATSRVVQLQLLDDQEPEDEQWLTADLTEVNGAVRGAWRHLVGIRPSDGWTPSQEPPPPAAPPPPAPDARETGGGGVTTLAAVFALLFGLLAAQPGRRGWAGRHGARSK